MSIHTDFQSNIDFFVDSTKEGRCEFSQIFSDPDFDDEKTSTFTKNLSTKITSQKHAKYIASCLPSSLVKKIYFFFYDLQSAERLSINEWLRSQIALTYCQQHEKVEANTLIHRMQQMEIKSEENRYEFAVQAAKRDVPELAYYLSEFQIEDPTLLRKLADRSVDVNPIALLTDYNEFSLQRDTYPDLYLLRSLIRVSDVFDLLTEQISDRFLVAQFPKEILRWIYTKFQYGKSIIEEVKKDHPSEFSKSDEADVFASLVDQGIKKPYWKWEPIQPGFLDRINDHQKFPLFALLYLLIFFPKGAIEIQEIQNLTTELEKFHDPRTRFGIIALALVENLEPVTMPQQRNPEELAQLVSKKDLNVKENPCILSLVLSTIEKFGEFDSRTLLQKKWKDKDFQKLFLRFLAELVLCEKLTKHQKHDVLKAFFTNKKLQTKESLQHYSTCIASRLTKSLPEGKDPAVILSENELDILNRLGQPFGRELSESMFSKLNYKEDLRSYALSLGKLSDEDKKWMVPTFFRFLCALAEGDTEELRNSEEMNAMFQQHRLDRKIWEKETSYPVEEILKKYPPSQNTEEKSFDLLEALEQSFKQGHLDEYEDVRLALFEGKGKLEDFELEGRIFGQYKGKGSPEQKMLAVKHLFYLLLEKDDPKYQRTRLTHLLKMFPAGDFRIDLNQWIHALNPGSQLDLSKFKIHRSADPYILFRVGNVAGESCQRTDGDPAKNKCLLAYPIDAKNQVIYIENQKGEIQSRAILRFFYANSAVSDSEQKQIPVLYLETIYPTGSSLEERRAITGVAIECATELNIPLVRHCKRQETADSPFSISTINGPAPYEYYDGLEIKVKRNNFKEGQRSSETLGTIDKSELRVLYIPIEENPSL